MENEVSKLNRYWNNIYYHLHYPHKEKITHQVIRILQHIEKQEKISINEVADYLNVSQNTASEHIKRSIKKNLVIKRRDPSDERKVILCLTSEGKDTLYRNTSLNEEELSLIFNSLNQEEKELIINAFKLLSERANQCIQS